MSWLKLTSGSLYLMQGGSNLYLDKAKIHQNGEDDGKLFGELKEFPYRWFTSSFQRPRTLVVNLDEETDGVPRVSSFSNKLLRYFEVPISFALYEQLKSCQKVSDLITTFDANVGGFTDDFFRYEQRKVLPPSITYIGDSGDTQITGFPAFNYKPNDPDYDEAEPSFANILLPVVWNTGLTVKPVLSSSTNADSIRVDLILLKSDLSVTTTEAVTLQTLDLSLKYVDLQIEDKALKDVLKLLRDSWTIPVNLSSSETAIVNKKISVGFGGNITFVTAMNAICRNLNSVWGWTGNTAFIQISQER